MSRRARPLRVSAPWIVLALASAGCGGSPPTELAGFSLAMSQEQVITESRRRAQATCHIKGTRPRVTVCEGVGPDEEFRVIVVNDTTTHIRVTMRPDGRRPQRVMRRFTRAFGKPVWRERPHQPPLHANTGFHTLWLNRDSTRAVALVCADTRLAPPCAVELARTSPPAVEAILDELLGIRR
jgi:hypothetical protein